MAKRRPNPKPAETKGINHRFMHTSRDFQLGWEAGEFYSACTGPYKVVQGVFHMGNEGELLRIARLYGYRRVVWRARPDVGEEACEARFVFDRALIDA